MPNLTKFVEENKNIYDVKRASLVITYIMKCTFYSLPLRDGISYYSYKKNAVTYNGLT